MDPVKASVVPTYMADPMYHLAMRIPLYSTHTVDEIAKYFGAGPDSPVATTSKAPAPKDASGLRDPLDQPKPSRELNRSEKWLAETRTKLQSRNLYLVRRMYKVQNGGGRKDHLSDFIYCFRGVGFAAEGGVEGPPDLSELLINKRVTVPRTEDGSCDGFPADILISTLWDPEGWYLPRELPYFPRLMGYTLHKVKRRTHGKLFPTPSERAAEPLDSSSEEEDDGKDGKGKKKVKRTKERKEADGPGEMVFSMYFEYYNGGTLLSFMEKAMTRHVDGTNVSMPKVPETLMWHVLAEVGSAIITLQTGEHQLPGKAPETAKGWGCIVHRCINLTNVYLHFNTEDFDSTTESKRLEARCFPRVVLNNLRRAKLEDTEPYGTRFDRDGPPAAAWWDIYCLGLMLRKMLFFVDRRTTVKASGNQMYEHHKFTLPNTVREYADFKAPHDRDKDVYSADLINTLDMFDTAGNLQNNDLLTAANQARMPDIGTLKGVVRMAKKKVADYKGMAISALPQETRLASDISWAGPPDDNTGNVMLYRPRLRQGRDDVWSTAHEDLQKWDGPIEATRVEYTQDGVLIDGEKVAANQTGVIPFLHQHEKDAREGGKDGEKDTDKGKGKDTATDKDSGEKRKSPTDEFEAERQERRKRIRDERRADTILEAWNAVFFQGPRKPWWQDREEVIRVRGEIPFMDRWDEKYVGEFYQEWEEDYHEEDEG